MKMVFRVGFKVFSILWGILDWLAERAFKCRRYCYDRTGYAPF